MFKKIITLMMALSIFTASAQADTTTGLKAAFDELNYAITVEWDQKDRDFYNAQMKNFQEELRKLQSQGLTKTQMIEFAKSEVKNEKIARDLETAFNMISINRMNEADASKYMVETLKKSYSAGASWNGEAIVMIAVGLLIIGLAISVSGGSSSSGSVSVCIDTYYCPSCYYDYWYGYTCPPCYWTCI